MVCGKLYVFDKCGKCDLAISALGGTVMSPLMRFWFRTEEIFLLLTTTTPIIRQHPVYTERQHTQEPYIEIHIEIPIIMCGKSHLVKRGRGKFWKTRKTLSVKGLVM